MGRGERGRESILMKFHAHSLFIQFFVRATQSALASSMENFLLSQHLVAARRFAYAWLGGARRRQKNNIIFHTRCVTSTCVAGAGHYLLATCVFRRRTATMTRLNDVMSLRVYFSPCAYVTAVRLSRHAVRISFSATLQSGGNRLRLFLFLLRDEG